LPCRSELLPFSSRLDNAGHKSCTRRAPRRGKQRPTASKPVQGQRGSEQGLACLRRWPNRSKPPFQGGSTGSNPVGATDNTADQRPLFFFREIDRLSCCPSVTRAARRRACESPVPLSHIGSGTCVSLLDPAPAPGRQWLRYLCPTNSMGCGSTQVITCAHPSQGGRGHAGGAFDG
jgi:hypothetical protein